ncbi:unnamed protein product [Blepharisma stoltei]|uniref:Uncharacterized protein n=1 Tax=Blepharisma stoltei TaxID=1481888 RepID=A0AAU9JM14_9CILI|nr:unnamed protein product [Blepharisma stoltei]
MSLKFESWWFDFYPIYSLKQIDSMPIYIKFQSLKAYFKTSNESSSEAFWRDDNCDIYEWFDKPSSSGEKIGHDFNSDTWFYEHWFIDSEIHTTIKSWITKSAIEWGVIIKIYPDHKLHTSWNLQDGVKTLEESVIKDGCTAGTRRRLNCTVNGIEDSITNFKEKNDEKWTEETWTKGTARGQEKVYKKGNEANGKSWSEDYDSGEKCEWNSQDGIVNGKKEGWNPKVKWTEIWKKGGNYEKTDKEFVEGNKKWGIIKEIKKSSTYKLEWEGEKPSFEGNGQENSSAEKLADLNNKLQEDFSLKWKSALDLCLDLISQSNDTLSKIEFLDPSLDDQVSKRRNQLSSKINELNKNPDENSLPCAVKLLKELEILKCLILDDHIKDPLIKSLELNEFIGNKLAELMSIPDLSKIKDLEENFKDLNSLVNKEKRTAYINKSLVCSICGIEDIDNEFAQIIATLTINANKYIGILPFDSKYLLKFIYSNGTQSQSSISKSLNLLGDMIKSDINKDSLKEIIDSGNSAMTGVIPNDQAEALVLINKTVELLLSSFANETDAIHDLLIKLKEEIEFSEQSIPSKSSSLGKPPRPTKVRSSKPPLPALPAEPEGKNDIEKANESLIIQAENYKKIVSTLENENSMLKKRLGCLEKLCGSKTKEFSNAAIQASEEIIFQSYENSPLSSRSFISERGDYTPSSSVILEETKNEETESSTTTKVIRRIIKKTTIKKRINRSLVS